LGPRTVAGKPKIERRDPDETRGTGITAKEANAKEPFLQGKKTPSVSVIERLSL